MNKTSRSLVASLGLAFGLVSVQAAATDFGSTEPALYWRMDFGAPRQAPMLAYGFALRHASTDTERAVPALVQFDVSQDGALTRLAGVPVRTRSFQRNQTDEAGAQEPATAPAEKTPWYGRQWVWWTGAGLAATAAIVAGADDDPSRNDSDGPGPEGRGGVLCDNNGENCAVPCPGPSPNSCVGFNGRAALPQELLHEPERLRTGSGQMGDLIER